MACVGREVVMCAAFHTLRKRKACKFLEYCRQLEQEKAAGAEQQRFEDEVQRMAKAASAHQDLIAFETEMHAVTESKEGAIFKCVVLSVVLCICCFIVGCFLGMIAF